MAGSSYKQSIPSPATPICDPGTGRINDAWLQFLVSLSARTGGAAGPMLDLGTVAGTSASNTAAAADAAALAWLGDAPQPPPDIGPVTAQAAASAAAIADLQALAALEDPAAMAPASDDAAANDLVVSAMLLALAMQD